MDEKTRPIHMSTTDPFQIERHIHTHTPPTESKGMKKGFHKNGNEKKLGWQYLY